MKASVSYTKSTKGSNSINSSAVKAKATRLGWKPVEVSGTIDLHKELSKKDDIKTYTPAKEKLHHV
ncbi:hypothetical protein A9P82_05765 [Arachidicoccus ginsenosidimutans]|uniref:hypothetical protein n=1 Tax=Arachidicoccus sp. BS20 TaxID=1850526 RepID=UPI0007F17D9E|nr:hypothetical protein [Arachidicoccus sp. BS20]ANI88838.1 hypothetical protein A9P82_05765 [Arachidicoccus sp. BS20]